VDEELWGRRPPPAAGPDATTIARFEPNSLADLTRCRRRLTAALHAESRPPDADEGAVERLLLTLEELASNALRHGDAPVRLAITAYDMYWLLEVSDAAPHRPPAPAVGRDAAQGGLGLYLVSRVAGAHGWIDDGHRKTTWARIDYTRAEVSPEEQSVIPRPRSGPRTSTPEH
jgi:anti-sigma regulatory factor (Ser/Thr protein kinase)